MEGRLSSYRRIPAPELIVPGRVRPETTEPEVKIPLTESELTNLVANIASLKELCELLVTISEIPGASRQRDRHTGEEIPYSGVECVKRIERILKKEGNINSITRACGLREAVRRLLEQS